MGTFLETVILAQVGLVFIFETIWGRQMSGLQTWKDSLQIGRLKCISNIYAAPHVRD